MTCDSFSILSIFIYIRMALAIGAFMSPSYGTISSELGFLYSTQNLTSNDSLWLFQFKSKPAKRL